MAGERRRRREQFFTDHPSCIFCGGKTPATEEDHIPSRQLFDMRQWPEGFVYPACSRCNRATKDDEQKIALISRMYPDAETAVQRDEIRTIMQRVHQNYPELLREIKPSPRRVREFYAKRGMRKPLDAISSEIPLLWFGGPVVASAMEQFARKLLLSLHYKETRQIVPRTGGVLWRWYTNVQAIEKELPDEFIRLLGGTRKVQRASRDLREQFDYIFGVADTGGMAAYFASFRLSFAIVGLIAIDERHLPRQPDNTNWGILYPLS